MFFRHWIHYHLARFHLPFKRHDEAAAAYRAALRAHPGFTLAAASHREQGDHHKAVEMFQQAAGQSPEGTSGP